MPSPAYEQPQQIDVIDSARPGRPRTPRTAIAIAAVLALAAGLGYWWTRQPGPAPVGTPTTPPATSAGLPDRPGSTPLPAGLDLGAVLLPVRPPRVLATASAATRPITGLPGDGGWDYAATEIGTGRYLVTARPPFSGQGTEPETGAYLVEPDRATATRIAEGPRIAASADNATILVTRSTADTGHRIQRYRLGGQPSGAAFTLPPGHTLVRETVDGMLLAGKDGSWSIWDPARGFTGHQFSRFVAAGPRTLVYADGDALSVIDLGTGRNRQLLLPDRVGNVHGAALSLDGRHLAVALADLQLNAWTVAVVATDGSSTTLMPGTPFRIADKRPMVEIGWHRDVLTMASGGVAYLWRPGTREVHQATE